MEFKKKTIIWEDNNEPPKDYIWAKKDGKFYEYSYATRSWIESKLIKTEESDGSDSGDDSGGGGEDGGNGNNSNTFFQLATIQPNRYVVFPPDGDTITLIDIENLDLDTFANYTENNKDINFFYSKEEISKLGISLEELETLECSAISNHLTPTENNSIRIDNSVITDNFIIKNLEITDDGEGITGIDVSKMRLNNGYTYFIMRFAYGDNNNYAIMDFRAIG